VNPFVLAADPGAGGAFVQFLPFILIFGIFYFLLILPQQRQRKKAQEMLANLKTGDRVITSGGVYGTIVGFRDANVVHLQVAQQIKIDVARSAITGLQAAEGEAADKGKK
jgi:preprotein translocase subunit YajC